MIPNFLSKFYQKATNFAKNKKRNKKQRTMKIYKYKVAMMVAAAWFIATALFCTIPSVWQAVVAIVLALVPLPLMRYEHETRRNEKLRAVGFALIVVLCNICVLTLTHHHV